MEKNDIILSVVNVTKTFGGLRALDSFSINVEKGTIVGLIGPNGAGKTTFFNVLTGIYNLEGGEIYFLSKKINTLKAHNITSIGIARTFQNARLFPNMTALENVMVGRHCRTKSEVFSALFRTSGFEIEERDILEKAKEYLEYVGLIEKANTLAKNLPFGEQRKLEIARALATSPILLLLDEPTCGMNPQETGDVMELISHLRERNITILLIEHDMKVVMGISKWIVVLDYGVKIAEGTPSYISKNEKVIEAYLGSSLSSQPH